MVGKTRGIYEMFEEIIFFLYRMKLGGGWGGRVRGRGVPE